MEDFQKSTQEFWPTEEDFKAPSEVLKWRDIENGIYKIHCFKEIKNKYGITFILELSTKENEDVFEVWAPQRLADKISENEKKYNFVLKEGTGKSIKTGNFYFKFSLL